MDGWIESGERIFPHNYSMPPPPLTVHLISAKPRAHDATNGINNRVARQLIVVQDDAHAAVFEGGGVEILIAEDGRHDGRLAAVHAFGGKQIKSQDFPEGTSVTFARAHQATVGHEHFDVRMAENIDLRQPRADMNVLGTCGERVVLPLPQNSLRQTLEGFDYLALLANRHAVGVDYRAPRNVNYSVLGAVEQLLQVVGQLPA